MKKRYILILILFLTIGFASINVSLFLHGDLVFGKNNLINSVYLNEANAGYNWNLSYDANGNGTPDFGDKLCLGTECFWVYDTSGSNYKLLAEYNLEVGNSSNSSYPANDETNIQSYFANGYNYAILKFHTSSSNYSSSYLVNYVNEYKNILVKMGISNSSVVSALSKSEVESIINKYTGNTISINVSISLSTLVPGWLYQTSYWLNTPYNATAVWLISSNGDIKANSVGNQFGLRPTLNYSKR